MGFRVRADGKDVKSVARVRWTYGLRIQTLGFTGSELKIGLKVCSFRGLGVRIKV